MKTGLITIDLEEFVYPYEHRIPFNRKEAFNISLQGLHDLLEEIKIPITFFSTIEFMKYSPKTIKLLIKNNEIGIHGISHHERTNKELPKLKKEMEEQFNYSFSGYRSPRFRNINKKIILNAGLSYDSSVHPRIFSEQMFEKRTIQTKIITEIPVSVSPVLRIPLSWVWFRNYPFPLIKLLTRLILMDNDYIMLYFHPWDFYNLQSQNIPCYYKRNTGIKAVKKLKKYILWLGNYAKFKTISEYLNDTQLI